MSNAVIKATLKVIRACFSRKIPFALEIPQTSILWNLPEIRHWTEQKGSTTIFTDMRHRGAPRNKLTKTWFAFFDEDWVKRRALRCRPRACICSRAGQAHPGLSGKGPGGIWKTSTAQAHPRKFARILGSVFVHQLQYDRLRSTRSLDSGGDGQL